MEVTINAETIITVSAVLAALGGIGGVVVWCNGPVTAALDKLEKHLNQAAHEEEE